MDNLSIFYEHGSKLSSLVVTLLYLLDESVHDALSSSIYVPAPLCGNLNMLNAAVKHPPACLIQTFLVSNPAKINGCALS